MLNLFVGLENEVVVMITQVIRGGKSQNLCCCYLCFTDCHKNCSKSDLNESGHKWWSLAERWGRQQRLNEECLLLCILIFKLVLYGGSEKFCWLFKQSRMIICTQLKPSERLFFFLDDSFFLSLTHKHVITTHFSAVLCQYLLSFST